MNEKDPSPGDPRLSALLREARPSPAPPPRFQQNVWRRIEDADVPPVSESWLETLAGVILRPKFAIAAAAIMLLAGVLAGTVEGQQLARHDAQMNYLASVDPQSSR